MGNSPTSKYKQTVPFDVRMAECQRIRSKHPKHIPIIVEKYESRSVLNNVKDLTHKTHLETTPGHSPYEDIPDIKRKRYLLPPELTFGDFACVIREKIQLKPDQTIFLFVGFDSSVIPVSSAIIGSIYEQHKDSDGYLYIFYTGTNFFGSFSDFMITK